jgi:preprotein translocase subunit SecA
MKNLIYDIKVENTKLGQKTNEELEEKITQVKKQSKVESLDKVLVKWFALVQELNC